MYKRQGLTDGSRVPKHSPRPQAYGSVDELNSSLGMVYFCLNKENSNLLHIEIKNLIREIQNDLFDLGADLAMPISKGKEKYPALRIKKEQIDKIENKIANLTVIKSNKIKIATHPIVASYINKGWFFSSIRHKWEQKFNKTIKVVGDERLHLLQYSIVKS